MRTIRLMPEYDCHPIWEDTDDGVVNLEPKDLPVSPGLAEDIARWSDDYDETFNEEYPPDSGFSDPGQEYLFDERGRVLWEQLIHELHGIANVRYFSVRQNTLLDPN